MTASDGLGHGAGAPADATQTLPVRDRVLEAAKRLFITRGFNASNLREIARTAQVSMGAIYHHFASKEEIYEALLPSTAFAQALPRIVALFRADSFPENLPVIARAIHRLVRDHPDDFKLVYVDVLEFQARNVAALFDALNAAFASQAEAALSERRQRGELADVHPKVFTRCVVALCLYLHLEDAMLERDLCEDIGIDDEELARQIGELLLHGILRA